MSHSLAERFHHDEKRLRTVLETTLLQYGVMLGMLVVLLILGLALVFSEP